jgi:hypothetical protein
MCNYVVQTIQSSQYTSTLMDPQTTLQRCMRWRLARLREGEYP